MDVEVTENGDRWIWGDSHPGLQLFSKGGLEGDHVGDGVSLGGQVRRGEAGQS